MNYFDGKNYKLDKYTNNTKTKQVLK